MKLPVSILLGLAAGVFCGVLMVWLFKKIHMRDTVKMLLLFGTAFLFVTLETAVSAYIPISGLLAVMALGGTILKKDGVLAKRLLGKFSKVWIGAEMILFVLVGAAVDIGYIGNVGLTAVCLIFAALVFRTAGVLVCLIKTDLSQKERLFCAVAYLPKATVQAAIGGIPLAMGIAAGNIILSVAVLAIMITAPVGAIGMDVSYQKLLGRNQA